MIPFRALSLVCVAALLCGCSKRVAEPATDPTRESVIDDIKRWSPEVRAAAVRDAPSFKLCVEAQESGVCHVHRIRMERTWLPVAYGLPTMPDWSEEEAAEYFPLANHGYLLGGCVRNEVEQTEVHVCAACTAALEAWKKAHADTP